MKKVNRQILWTLAFCALFVPAIVQASAGGNGNGQGNGHGGGGGRGGGGGGAASAPVIAFVHGGWFGELVVMDADGGNKTQLTDFLISRPTWSPDASEIVFEGYANSGLPGGLGVYAIAPDGSGMRQIATKQGLPTSGAAWSPVPTVDGTSRIAFCDTLPGDSGGSLFLVRPDGSDVLRLTFDAGDKYPSWSPDGTRIAVQRAADIQIIELSAATGSLGSASSTSLGVSMNVAAPQWSKTSDLIAFGASPLGGGESDIWTIDAQSGFTNNVTNDPVISFMAPSFSADDTQIVMASNASGHRLTIHVVDATGGNLQNLGGGGRLGRGHHNHPTWKNP